MGSPVIRKAADDQLARSRMDARYFNSVIQGSRGAVHRQIAGTAGQVAEARNWYLIVLTSLRIRYFRLSRMPFAAVSIPGLFGVCPPALCCVPAIQPARSKLPTPPGLL